MNHSIIQIIADKFMYYYENFLKKKIFRVKIVESASRDTGIYTEMDIPNDLIYWNISDKFLHKVMIKNSDFLLNEKKLRNEFIRPK